MRVRRVGRLAVCAPHLLGIAVIGGDEERSIGSLDGAREPAEASVHRGDGSHRRAEVARVTHHVRVGEVHDDEVERPPEIASTTRSVTSGADISGCRS